MLKKTIKYTDYNGEVREEDFYFNLTKAELIELEASINGGLERMVKQIVDAKDGAEIMRLFKQIILMSYGEKTLDGKYFNKSEQISNDFSHTEAYSELFMELVTNADAASAFITRIIPELPPEAKTEAEARAKETIK